MPSCFFRYLIARPDISRDNSSPSLVQPFLCLFVFIMMKNLNRTSKIFTNEKESTNVTSVECNAACPSAFGVELLS